MTISVGLGEVVAMVGRNGAGKSTSILAIGGITFGPSKGSVRLGGQELHGRSPSEVVAAGLSIVPEGHRVPGYECSRQSLDGVFAIRRRSTHKPEASIDDIYSLFPRLGVHDRRVAGQLSGGLQQMLSIGQARMGAARAHSFWTNLRPAWLRSSSTPFTKRS